jgi:Leucine-rich repeat (LRR) protein
MNRLKLLSIFIIISFIGRANAQNNISDSLFYDKQVVNVAGNYNLNITPASKMLTAFPVAICKIVRLNVINLVSHEIPSIPSQIGNLKELTVLNMPNNKLKSLPKEIGQLTNLRILNLSKNQLTKLPDELGNCKNLKTLNICENNISQFEIDKIQALLPNCNIIVKMKTMSNTDPRNSTY